MDMLALEPMNAAQAVGYGSARAQKEKVIAGRGGKAKATCILLRALRTEKIVELKGGKPCLLRRHERGLVAVGVCIVYVDYRTIIIICRIPHESWCSYSGSGKPNNNSSADGNLQSNWLYHGRPSLSRTVLPLSHFSSPMIPELSVSVCGTIILLSIIIIISFVRVGKISKIRHIN